MNRPVLVQSIDDPHIDNYRTLPNSSVAKRRGKFIVEGAWLVERLLASEFEVESVFVDRSRADEFSNKIPQGVALLAAERDLFEQIVGFDFHRCVMACGRRPVKRTLDDVLAGTRDMATVVICDSIQDPENLGGVLRNCAAFGVDAVCIGASCADVYSRRVIRVSMGAVFKLAITEPDDLVEEATSLKDQFGFELTASTLDASATPLESATRAKKTALLFGNEASGLLPDVTRACDRRVTIPMQLGTDSLNVAVASGIYLHHFTRMMVSDCPKGNARRGRVG